jgi:hypothetical protein
MNDKSKEVETLIEKAAKANDSGDAMRFSQAACNAANAMTCVRNMPKG